MIFLLSVVNGRERFGKQRRRDNKVCSGRKNSLKETPLLGNMEKEERKDRRYPYKRSAGCTIEGHTDSYVKGNNNAFYKS